MRVQHTFWVNPRNMEKPCLSLCSLMKQLAIRLNEQTTQTTLVKSLVM